MKISIYTPDKPVLKQQPVLEVIVPSIMGELGILPGHTSLISLLQVGVLKYLPEGKDTFEKVAVSWGYIEIEGDHIKILAESVQTKEALDRSKNEKDLKKILKELEKIELAPEERRELESKKLHLESELQL